MEPGGEFLSVRETAEARLDAEGGEEISANLGAFDGEGGAATAECPDAFVGARDRLQFR